MLRIDTYSAPLIESLPISGNVESLLVAYSIGPVSVKNGDVVKLKFKIQITNDNADLVIVRHCIINTNSATNTEGRLISSRCANSIPSENCVDVRAEGIEDIDCEKENVFYNFIVYAPSKKNIPSALKIAGEGYGEKCIEIHPNPALISALLMEEQKEIAELKDELSAEKKRANDLQEELFQIEMKEQVEEFRISQIGAIEDELLRRSSEHDKKSEAKRKATQAKKSAEEKNVEAEKSGTPTPFFMKRGP